MEINISNTGAPDPMEDFQLSAPDAKGKKYENVPILTASGRELGKEGKEGFHSMVIEIHDTMKSATQDIDGIPPTTLTIALQFPPGDPMLLPQYVLDSADPKNPTICPLSALLVIDRNGGLQAQIHALNQGIDSNKVKDQAFDHAMRKYEPPLSEAQIALINQHKTTYFKNPNNPAIPENTRNLMDRLTQQAAAEINKQFGLPDSIQSSATTGKNTNKKDAEESAFKQAMEEHQPPLTEAQRQSIIQYHAAFSKSDPTVPENVKTLLQHLTENAAIIMKKNLSQISHTTSTAQAEEASAEAAQKNVGTQNTQSTQASQQGVSKVGATNGVEGASESSGTQGINRANPWEASTAYLAFEMAFMQLVRLMMAMKLVEAQVQLNAQNLQYAMAKNSADMMISEAKNEQYQYMVDAICNGIAFAGTIAAGAIGLAGSFLGLKEELPLSKEPPATTLEIKEPMPKPGETVNEFGHTAEQVKVNNAKIEEANTKIQERNTSIEKKGKELKATNEKIELKESQIKSQAADAKQLKSEIKSHIAESRADAAGIDNLSEANDATKAEINAMKRDPAPAVPEGAEKLTPEQIQAEQAKIEEYNTKTVGKENERVNGINEKVKADNAQIRAKNEKIKAINDGIVGRRQMLSQMLSGSFQQITNMTTSAVKSSLAVVQGYYKGQQAILQTSGQLMGQLAQSAGDAMKADSDMLTQTIQMLDAIRQKLMEAVSSMLRGK